MDGGAEDWQRLCWLPCIGHGSELVSHQLKIGVKFVERACEGQRVLKEVRADGVDFRGYL